MTQNYELKYLKLLSNQYPTINSVSTEIINLSAILKLPKGTEHFLTDIHGEHEAFDHVLRNASGVIKRKINDAFKETLSYDEKQMLATLIYYPKEKLEIIRRSEIDMDTWHRVILHRLIILCRAAAYKYTRSKVRKLLPENFAYIIEELFHENEDSEMKQSYFQSIIDTMIDIECADEFIIELCKLIRELVIDRLHIIGDIYDRGPGAHIIMDLLKEHHSIDIQWGNHDILWMGAASGCEACIANTLRIALRYGNLETLEDGYGINLSPLIRFTIDLYNDKYPKSFRAKVKGREFKEKDIDLLSRMQMAIAIIQLKLEGQIIKRRPEFNMDNRLFLDTLDLENATVVINSKVYDINSTNFPTIDMEDPYKLSDEENMVMSKLKASFVNSEKLNKHVKFLYNKGSMYSTYNNNLLFHGCVPLDEKGEFAEFYVNEKSYSGKVLMDYFESMSRKAYFSTCEYEKSVALDNIWYVWCGELSTLFGKSKMATFERYYIEDSSSHLEIKNSYFELRDSDEICIKILNEFGLNSRNSHIINGHVPVKVKTGEIPVKANGKLIAIDGGFSKAYQNETGIAGYTLIFNSRGMMLVEHKAFESKDISINEDRDMLPTKVFIEKDQPRMYVGDTDIGCEIKDNIKALKELLKAYKSGHINEKI
ncbi:MAG: fructose-1,6-bisphosphatase [Acidaminobacteraceae bacterium]